MKPILHPSERVLLDVCIAKFSLNIFLFKTWLRLEYHYVCCQPYLAHAEEPTLEVFQCALSQPPHTSPVKSSALEVNGGQKQKNACVIRLLPP